MLATGHPDEPTLSVADRWRIMTFSEDLAKAREQAAQPDKSEPIPVVVGGVLYELQFTKADGLQWAAVTSKHPPRLDQPIDRTYGFNFHAVTAEIAETTCEVTQDGKPVVLVKETWSRQNPEPKNEWADLFSVIDGSAYSQLADAAFQLNQWGPDQKVAALKKASRPASEASSD